MADPAWTNFERAQDAEVAGQNFQVWVNNLFTVLVRLVKSPGWPDMIHLSIRRMDRQIIDDWRDKQRIKNMIVGPEHEGIELFPAESRLVDSANQFHLWVLSTPEARFPFGFQERLVSENTSVSVGGGASQQRPFNDDNRPSDLATQADIDKAIEEYHARNKKPVYK
jgi:hypothetical protein